MSLQIERIPTFGDNYTYLVICETTREAAVIDAPEAEPVVRRVEKTGARVTGILSTHHHPDHSMANPELAKRSRNILMKPASRNRSRTRSTLLAGN